MTNDIQFKTMQHASARLIEAQEKIFEEFDSEVSAVRSVSILLYVKKVSGRYDHVTAQALLRDYGMPTKMLIGIMEDQLARLKGEVPFDEMFQIEVTEDQSKKRKGEGE